MLSGLTLPEDNLDHRGEKPRGDGHLEWKGGLLAQKNNSGSRKQSATSSQKRNLWKKLAGANQDGRVSPAAVHNIPAPWEGSSEHSGQKAHTNTLQ